MKISIDRRRLRQRMIEEDKNSLIRALKADDPKAAKQALTGMNGEDLGLTHQEFNQLAKEIADANKNIPVDGMSAAGMNIARKILGVGKDVKQTIATHNPVTGQPWSSGSMKQGQGQQDKLNKDELKLLWKHGNKYKSDFPDLLKQIGNGILKNGLVLGAISNSDLKREDMYRLLNLIAVPTSDPDYEKLISITMKINEYLDN